VITVDDFHKAYEKTVAVSGISFDVAEGEILGLVGPNGAGKTRTLKTLSCVISPTRGRLTVHGYDVERDPVEVKRRIAYVPDDPQLFPDLSVNQHLAFTASAYGVKDADKKAAHLMDLFELSARRSTPARDLSRGMRQKLAICCAYLHDPSTLLFDEPLTGLDPRGIRMLKECSCL
jgi:ABC-2 type transport system ATP-binding protein